MAIKNAWSALFNKQQSSNEKTDADETAITIAQSDIFPVVQIPNTALSRYNKIPLAGLGALGAAFSQLPEGARTIVQTTTHKVATNETLFVGINPKGVSGFLRENLYGTTGNIMQYKPNGKQVIAGRMRFKAIDGLPVNETNTTTLPLDPTTMMIAVAVMAIEHKLDKIQQSVEAVLRFLQEDKQAGQRGRLNRLAEIADEFKKDCTNTGLLNQRNIEVQSIQTKAMENIEFYQTRISSALQKEKLFHISKDAKQMLYEVGKEFAEYQLACYTYGFCAFLDIMLRKDFRETAIQFATDKMNAMSNHYTQLFEKCHSQLSSYQRNAIEAKVVDGIGIAAKGLGKAIGAIPVIKEGPVDEALIAAGQSLGNMNQNSVQKKMVIVEKFESSRMEPFIESLHSVDIMHNKPDAMFTDGQNLYVLAE